MNDLEYILDTIRRSQPIRLGDLLIDMDRMEWDTDKVERRVETLMRAGLVKVDADMVLTVAPRSRDER